MAPDGEPGCLHFSFERNLMVIIQTDSWIGRCTLVLLVLVFAATLWIAWHYQQSATMMRSGIEAMIGGYKKIETRVETLEKRIKNLEGH